MKELSKLLIKKVTTEKANDDEGSADGDDTVPAKPFKEKEDATDKFCSHPLFFLFKEIVVAHRVETALHEAHRIMPHFVPEILTPPPNRA